MKRLTKSNIAIFLSKLKSFENPNFIEEQYTIDSEIASDILWNAFLIGDIKDKVVADFGSGTGFIGISCLLLGAKKVYFVEKDKNVIKILEENLKGIEGNYEIINKDVVDFNIDVDVVIQNPPFGVKKKHYDRVFLGKAFDVANVVYSLHKIESDNFLKGFSKDNGFRITHRWVYDFPLKKTMKFHRKRIYYFKVGCYRFESIN